MNNLPNTTCDSGKRYGPGTSDQPETLKRLRLQSRWAALLLFTPWLLTIFSCWQILGSTPFTLIGLLPGLAAAIHIERQLSFHLTSNHRPCEEGILFSTLGAANWITLLRAGAIVALAGFLPPALLPGYELASLEGLIWVPGLTYLCVSMLDLLDGYAARKQHRETELGKQLDIITDAAGLLVASMLAVALGRLPFIYLLVGIAYYPFIFGIWFRKKKALPVNTLLSRPYARIIAGCQMGLVGIALLPTFTVTFTFIGAYILMTPLLLGFIRDWLVVSCRIKTDINQQTNLDLWVCSLTAKALPFTLRLIVFGCGIITLAGYSVFQTHLPWQLFHSLCCLLAGIGFMGRSASLVLLLLLASNQSPFGITLISTTLFATSAALMLTGTGPRSLWRPEERILYRHNTTSTSTTCDAL